jgi:glucan phosphorylase
LFMRPRVFDRAMLFMRPRGQVMGWMVPLRDVKKNAAAILNALRHSDYYMVTVDFDSYCATQRSVERLWQSTSDWMRASMLNVARTAWFSFDRIVGEYAQDIWKVPFELPSNREREQRS